MTDRFGHVLWNVAGLPHQRRARTVSEHLRRLPGVLEAEANATGPLRIEFDRSAYCAIDAHCLVPQQA